MQTLPFKPISIGDECSWAKEYFSQLKQSENIEVSHSTTDPDTASHRAVDALYKDGITSTCPDSAIDTRHLSQNHRKFIKKSNSLLKLMPGKTAKAREKARNTFALDLAQRCHAEFNCAFDNCRSDTQALVSKLSYASDAVIKCYQGDHSKCKDHSLVCPDKQGRDWLTRSTFLSSGFRINCNGKDFQSNESLLRMMVQYRLGRTTVLKTKYNTNTQKCESVNKIIKRSLPTRLTFSRNMQGRAHSSIHAANNGPGESVLKLCNVVGTTIDETSKVWSQLKEEQRRHEKHKRYKRTEKFRAKRAAKRMFLYKLYEKFQDDRTKYKKGLLLTSIANKLKKKYIQLDHTYNDNSKRKLSAEHSYSKQT